jgi:protein-S-isoprenylcysteine O-methyltransferase Ste14
MNHSALADETNPFGPKPTWSRRAHELLMRHRVRISVVVFVALILEDVLEHCRPRDLADVHDPWMVAGLTLVVGGLALRSWAAGTLRKMAQLTTEGPYAAMRHPLYVGSFMMMVGFSDLINDEENIYVVCGPILLLYILKVLSEERQLAGKFGAAWNEYAARAPRFVPRRWPRHGFDAWSFKQWLGSREYRALAGGLLGLVALELWRLA